MLDAVAELAPYGAVSRSTKRCFVCGEAVVTSCFTPRVKCSDCRKAAKKAYSAARYLAKRGEIRAQAAARYAANPDPVKARTARRYAEKKSEALAKNAEWQRKNTEKVAVRNAKWKHNNRAKTNATSRKRYQRNQASEVAKVQLRRALKRTPFAERVSIDDIIARDGPRCYICGVKTDPRAKRGSPIKSHLEHVLPLSAGGTHIADNLRCACQRCNLLKSNKHSPQSVATLLLGFPIAT